MNACHAAEAECAALRASVTQLTANLEALRVENQQLRASADFKPGVYRHYKGNDYIAMMLVRDHESRELLVLYASMGKGSVQVRPLVGRHTGTASAPFDINIDGWTDLVEWPDGERRPRFVRTAHQPDE